MIESNYPAAVRTVDKILRRKMNRWHYVAFVMITIGFLGNKWTYRSQAPFFAEATKLYARQKEIANDISDLYRLPILTAADRTQINALVAEQKSTGNRIVTTSIQQVKLSQQAVFFGTVMLAGTVLNCVALTFDTWQRRRLLARVEKRICISCGYDLRASIDRCPECGTRPPTASPNSSVDDADANPPMRGKQIRAAR